MNQILDIPDLDPFIYPLLGEVTLIRRDIHAHPETGFSEFRTSQVLRQRLKDDGLNPIGFDPTGLMVDVEPDGWEHTIALRADIDALPLHDETTSAFTSRNAGVTHACGHDVHTAVALGAGLVLNRLAGAGLLRHRVRLIFQPAEEVLPGGSLHLMDRGALDGVDRILALHCDPHLDVGHVGLKVGAITSASDQITVRVFGKGGHTSRPHLTQDVVGVLGELITQTPTLLSRRLDTRSAVSLVWGHVLAGDAPNAIPAQGILEGTLRCMDIEAWRLARPILAQAVSSIGAAYGARIELDHRAGVPPTVNDPAAVALQEAAALAAIGPTSVVPTPQSMGGEDFAWYLEKVPGALARLGTRRPGGETYDLHRGNFDPDERAIEAGIRLMVGCALLSGEF